MSDIFLSYANPDRPRINTLVQALGNQGWTVWWDPKILPGKRWDQVIESELAQAKCVVVVWSTHSVESEWVQNEADEAKQRGIFVPALIDEVKIPLAFRRIQAANLVGWSGDLDHAEFRELCQAVHVAVDRRFAAIVPGTSTTAMTVGSVDDTSVQHAGEERHVQERAEGAKRTKEKGRGKEKAENRPERGPGILRPPKDTANIFLNIYTGARQNFPPGAKWSALTTDGRPLESRQLLVFPTLLGSSQLLAVPFFDGAGDFYSVTASAEGYEDSTWYPVQVFETEPVTVDLMMLPKGGGVIDFTDATWDKLTKSRSAVADIIRRRSEQGDFAHQYNLVIEARPEALACFLNAMTALAEIRLPSGRSALEYYWNTAWPSPGLGQTAWLQGLDQVFRADRFFCYVDQAIVSDIRAAVGQTFVSRPIGEVLRHSDLTERYRQTTFSLSNIQLTFYGKDTTTFVVDGKGPVGCIKVAVEIEYYSGILSHGLGHAFANWVNMKPQDPRIAYALRWMEARFLGLSRFDPLYRVV